MGHFQMDQSNWWFLTVARVIKSGKFRSAMPLDALKRYRLAGLPALPAPVNLALSFTKPEVKEALARRARSVLSTSAGVAAAKCRRTAFEDAERQVMPRSIGCAIPSFRDVGTGRVAGRAMPGAQAPLPTDISMSTGDIRLRTR